MDLRERPERQVHLGHLLLVRDQAARLGRLDQAEVQGLEKQELPVRQEVMGPLAQVGLPVLVQVELPGHRVFLDLLEHPERQAHLERVVSVAPVHPARRVHTGQAALRVHLARVEHLDWPVATEPRGRVLPVRRGRVELRDQPGLMARQELPLLG